MKLNNFTQAYFTTYNLITYQIDKLVSQSEYVFTTNNSNSSSNLDILNELNIPGTIISNLKQKLDFDINFKYIKDYPQIQTPNYREYYFRYIKKLIISNLSEKNFHLLNQIFIEYDYEPDLSNNKFSLDNMIQIINSDDFYGLSQILEIIFPNPEYKTMDTYFKHDPFYKVRLPVSSIQTYENKLFVQQINGLNIFYFYFSFGTLKNIERVMWEFELECYIKDITNLLSKPDTYYIILAGHSVGSIVIQHLVIQLIKNNIDTSKIYIIGSGCRMNPVLSDEELELFKQVFAFKYYFVTSAYVLDGKICYDHRSTEPTNKLNPINTNLLICDGLTFEKDFLQCVGISLDIIDFDLLSDLDNLQPNPNAFLHDFGFYSKLYLNQINL